MTKVNKPIKEFWESDKKPPYLKISKGEIVRFVRQRNKNKKNKRV